MPRPPTLAEWARTHIGVILLAAILAYAGYSYWRTVAALDRLCSLLGPHDVEVDHPRTVREQIDNICILHRTGDD
jgi:hypothetical protein